MKNTITACHMMCTLSNLFIISLQLRWWPQYMGRHWGKKPTKASVSEDVNLSDTKMIPLPTLDMSLWILSGPTKEQVILVVGKMKTPEMIFSKMCLPLELAMFVELPFLITALTGAKIQLWQLCTITNLATMGVKGHMSRGNQVGLEKTRSLIHPKCSCLASGGPDLNFKS